MPQTSTALAPAPVPRPAPAPVPRRERARELTLARGLSLQVVRTLALARAQGRDDAREVGRAHALELARKLTRTLERMWARDGGLDHELGTARKLIVVLTRSQALELAVAEREAVGLALGLAAARRQERAQPRPGLPVRMIALAAAIIPSRDRERYRLEWSAELEALEQDEQPVLGFASRTLRSAPSTAAVLWAGVWGSSVVRASAAAVTLAGSWRRSIAHGLAGLARWFGRATPLSQAILTALVALAAALVDVARGALRITLAVLAATAAGLLTFLQARTKHARRKDDR